MRTASARNSQIVSHPEGEPIQPPAAPANDANACAKISGTQTTRKPVDCGHLPFLIKRDGTWLYRGSPITRKPMVCLFSTILKRDEDGRYLLESPAERGFIDVEDVPFIAVELDWSGHGKTQTLCFRTNTDQCITAGPEHPIRIAHDLLTCEPTPYLHIRDGQGRFPVEARINRATYYELVALAEPGTVRGRPVLGVWSEGVFFSLGDLPAGCGKP
ncbi:MAG: hypothetical protein B7Y73_01025 [Acidocella sp. 35-58-6]|jgi:hypothetical protein|nr:MAG: hypothetical protein B7Y73_01025 [Acidocella sp. 35-58-6]